MMPMEQAVIRFQNEMLLHELKFTPAGSYDHERDQEYWEIYGRLSDALAQTGWTEKEMYSVADALGVGGPWGGPEFTKQIKQQEKR